MKGLLVLAAVLLASPVAAQTSTRIAADDQAGTARILRAADADSDGGTFWALWALPCFSSTAGCVEAGTAANPFNVTIVAAGALTHYTTSAAGSNATSVKASAGNVYLISAINTTATLYYLRLYNLASAPTCSSAVGFVETIPIPASATGAGVVRPSPVGKAFTTGIGFCLTGGGGSTDTTSAATGVYVTIEYK